MARYVDADQAPIYLNTQACEQIKSMPTADVRPERHGEWQATKKHLWYKDKDGKPDIFAYSSGFCNGVECKKCGEHVCVHCTPDWDSDNEDNDCYYKHYVCSCCKYETMEKTPYCPSCGAKMDEVFRKENENEHK